MSVKPTDMYGVCAKSGDLYVNGKRGWLNVSNFGRDYLASDEVPASVQPRDPADVVGNDIEEVNQ